MLTRGTVVRTLVGLVVLALFPAAPEARSAFAVVVNQKNRQNDISASDLARMFRGEQRRWRSGQEVVVINLPVSNSLRRAFYKSVLKAEPEQRFWEPGLLSVFSPMVVPSSTAVRMYVSQIEGAIGYIPADSVDPSVKQLQVKGETAGGRTPSDRGVRP